MNLELIEAAAKRLQGRVRRTPLLHSRLLDRIAGRRVLVKAECLQHTGSFKFRGGWSAISALPGELRSNGVVAFSSGNHAQGVALAATCHGTPSVIVMPKDAPKLKIENTRAFGGEVVLYDRPGGENRDIVGTRLSDERGLTLIHPFDEPQVIAGQGTVGLEIAAQIEEFGVRRADVLVCCGGGGLTAGIGLALEARAPELRTRPVEPRRFDDVTRSLISGRIERNETKTGSVCDAILTESRGKITFPVLRRLCGPGIVVSDEECLCAMAAAFYHLKIVIEPGGAAALAAVLYHPDAVTGEAAIVVATGGNVETSLFATALNTYNQYVRAAG